MLVRLCRDVMGFVPAQPKDFNTAERFQQFLAMRPDLAESWTRERRRGSLTLLDRTALVSADRGAGEVLHFAPGLTQGADRATCAPGHAWATLLGGRPAFLIRDLAVHPDSIISAPVIRGPV